MCTHEFVEHDPSRADIPDASDGSSSTVLSAPVLVGQEALATTPCRSTCLASTPAASLEELMRRQSAPKRHQETHLLYQLLHLRVLRRCPTAWSSAKGGTTGVDVADPSTAPPVALLPEQRGRPPKVASPRDAPAEPPVQSMSLRWPLT